MKAQLTHANGRIPNFIASVGLLQLTICILSRSPENKRKWGFIPSILSITDWGILKQLETWLDMAVVTYFLSFSLPAKVRVRLFQLWRRSLILSTRLENWPLEGSIKSRKARWISLHWARAALDSKDLSKSMPNLWIHGPREHLFLGGVDSELGKQFQNIFHCSTWLHVSFH